MASGLIPARHPGNRGGDARSSVKDASRFITMSDDDRQPRAERPDSTGTNSRPRDTTIGQTGEGIPDDSGRPVQVDEAEAKRIEEKIRKL